MNPIILSSILDSILIMTPPHAADVISMQRLNPPAPYRGYIVDANPLLGHNPPLPRTLALKAAGIAVTSFGDHQLGKRGKVWQWGGRILIYGAYGYIVVRHEQMRKERLDQYER